MRTLIVIAICAMLGGCSVTTGEWNRKLDKNEPWVLCHSGKEALQERIVEMLALNMWDVSTQTSNVILTAERRQMKDEDMRLVEQDAGMARLMFAFTDTTVSLNATVVKGSIQLTMYQGYPIMMKYLRKLEQLGCTVMPSGGCSALPGARVATAPSE